MEKTEYDSYAHLDIENITILEYENKEREENHEWFFWSSI